jgi:polar amino acid transport system substrate-binding protein
LYKKQTFNYLKGINNKVKNFIIKKAIYLGLLLFCLCGIFLSGCDKEKKPRLVMATNAAFHPYEYWENGKIVGIDPEIIKAIADNLGCELVIHDMKFESIIASVQTNKADIAAAGITITDDRKKMVDFTIPYVKSEQKVMVLNQSNIFEAKDLKNKRIGVQLGTTGDSYVTKNYGEPIRYDNGSLAVAALLAKKIDAIVLDGEPCQVHAARNPKIRILPGYLFLEEYAFAVKKGNEELLTKINAQLATLLENGKIKEIQDKYSNEMTQLAQEISHSSLAQTFWLKTKEAINLNFTKDNRYMYLVRGFFITIEITVFALLIGLAIGFTVAVIRSTCDLTGKLKFSNELCHIYLTVIRGTPVVVQLMIIYFVIFGSLDINKILIAIIAFGINSGAYVAEIVRSGIMSIDPGQMEAGRSLGLSYNKTMRLIILPQALKNVLPALGNEFIVLLKETSVAGFIAIQDLTKAGDIIRSQTYNAFLPLIAVAVIYLAVVMFLTKLLNKFEERLKKNER